MLPQQRDQVFISYSNRDARWLARLQTALKPLVWQEVISVWDDTAIKPGEKWQEKIEEALAAARVAVLLVSLDFLASDFIARHELPPLLKAAEREGVTILWVPVTSCLYDETEIAGYQVAHDPQKPLDGLSTAEWKRALTEIARKIKAAVAAGNLPSSVPGLWNVPARNPFFTGRADVLERLRREMEKTGRAALSGLGGMGKTQTAIEYAHRNGGRYVSALWVRADTPEALQSSVGEIARALGLPERDAPEPERVLSGLRRWLEGNANWLLVLDNADDLELAREILPSGGGGHVLFTTRAQMMGGLAARIRLPEMEPEDAALLLLRRAEILTGDATLDAVSESDRSEALALSGEVDGLPLALDQAGAYIAATRCGVAGYRRLYAGSGDRLRAKRGKGGAHDHEPVSRTFSLAFDRMANEEPEGDEDPEFARAARLAAADLLRLCAFLAPDAIPEEIINEGAADLGEEIGRAVADPLLYDAMMEQACRYSLLERDPDTRTLSLHRLVQDVLKDGMDGATRRVWAERSVRAVNHAFPDVEFSNWPECDRLLPHALVCAQSIHDNELELEEVAGLLNQAGFYLSRRGHYQQTEPLYRQALEIFKRVLGNEHPDTLISQNNLASLYYSQGRYSETEPLYKATWETHKYVLGNEHPGTLRSQNNLAFLYNTQGRYSEAEPLYKATWETQKYVLGDEHPDTLTSQNNLAALYDTQGRYSEAEPLYKATWETQKRVLGDEHPDTLASQNNLAFLYYSQGRYSEAEPLYKATWEAQKRVLGDEHPHTLNSQNNLAMLYLHTGRPDEAEPLQEQVVAAAEKVLGPLHPKLAHYLRNHAKILRALGRAEEAEAREERVAAIREAHAQQEGTPTPPLPLPQAEEGE